MCNHLLYVSRPVFLQMCVTFVGCFIVGLVKGLVLRTLLEFGKCRDS